MKKIIILLVFHWFVNLANTPQINIDFTPFPTTIRRIFRPCMGNLTLLTVILECILIDYKDLLHIVLYP